jgi:HAMP domain-containing protein
VKTLHVLILAGAMLGAAWMLKPVLVEQVSQVELQRREDAERDFQHLLEVRGTIPVSRLHGQDG